MLVCFASGRVRRLASVVNHLEKVAQRHFRRARAIAGTQ